MDNFNDSNLLNQDSAAPIPFDDGSADESGISHAPLDLGGGPAPAQKPAAPKPAAGPAQTPKIETPKSYVQKPAEKAVSTTDRITGVKTFFTKLHPGAMNFLDEQISDWLKENPDVRIKRTNIATGEVQAKKTEPNILITVWY
jgi:hypothetical protein